MHLAVLSQENHQSRAAHFCDTQASEDGEEWVDLRRHVGDSTIKMPGQFASWPISGRAAARLFGHFRVLLLPDPNAGAAASSDLALSSLELYGYLSSGGADGDQGVAD